MDVKTKIITQFVRDLSFENPNGPGYFKQVAIGPLLMQMLMSKHKIEKIPIFMKSS